MSGIVAGMDFTPAGTISQLQNTTFLTNVFMTSFLAALSFEGIKTIIGTKFFLSHRRSICNMQYSVFDTIQDLTRRDSN